MGQIVYLQNVMASIMLMDSTMLMIRISPVKQVILCLAKDKDDMYGAKDGTVTGVG